jgi:hypothetical protein
MKRGFRIQTRPGGALFEGTLRFDEETKNIQMMGDISRINRYGTQSHCIDTTNVKKFCYCKKQLISVQRFREEDLNVKS